MIAGFWEKDQSILATGWVVFLSSAREFGFKATMPLKDGLRKTVEWYQQTHRVSHSSSQRDQAS